MPPKKSSAPPATAMTATGKKPVFGITRSYLFVYNFVSFALWATCTIRTASLLLEQQQKYGFLDTKDISEIPNQIFPYLLLTQSLAILEIFHSLVGIVRAPLLTTAMQVGSRIMVVVGIMYAFREGSELAQVFPAVLTQGKPVSGDGLMGIQGKTQPCDLAFLGCMFAWGITECIRYGFFALQLGGMKVPGWWQWLRYNTFFVLYPIGIASECVFMYFGLGPAEKFVHVYYKWFIMAVIGIYVPGSYVLYTHMMAQRRRVMRGKSRVD